MLSCFLTLDEGFSHYALLTPQGSSGFRDAGPPADPSGSSAFIIFICLCLFVGGRLQSVFNLLKYSECSYCPQRDVFFLRTHVCPSDQEFDSALRIVSQRCTLTVLCA